MHYRKIRGVDTQNKNIYFLNFVKKIIVYMDIKMYFNILYLYLYLIYSNDFKVTKSDQLHYRKNPDVYIYIYMKKLLLSTYLKLFKKKNENPNVMWWCKIRAAHKYFKKKRKSTTHSFSQQHLVMVIVCYCIFVYAYNNALKCV